MKLLNKSIPYYIRCIKPNNSKKKEDFDGNEVMRQMRYAGLLEAIKIRKSGYEIRIKHHEFINKYRYIATNKTILGSMKGNINIIISLI
jgi:myosin heavy subunit